MKHPDYDIEFKPAIARYDWDQTYDVLEFVHLPQGFSGLMDMVNIPCYELMAIDRYTPYDYLWAEEYSDYVYNFLKQFNFSPHNSIQQRALQDESGQSIKDENNNFIIVPKFEFTGDKYSKTAEYPVTLTKGKYKLTCLINQGWKDGIIGSITTLNQAHYAFTLDETTEVDLNQIIDHWCKDSYGDSQFCINSLVLSKFNGSQWQSVAVDAPPFLFYQDIANYWGEVSQALLQYFDDVFNNHIEYFSNHFPDSSIYPLRHYLSKIYVFASYGRNGFQWYFNNFIRTNIADGYPSLYLNDPKLIGNYQYTFDQIPLMNNCYLQYANNNYWDIVGENLTDKGFICQGALSFAIHQKAGNKYAPFLPLYRRPNNNINNINENVVFSRKNYLWLGFDIDYINSLYPYIFTKIPNICSSVEFNYFITIFRIELKQYMRIKLIDSCFSTYRDMAEIEEIHPYDPFMAENVELYIKNRVFSQQEWEDLYNYDLMPDTEYLDYLLQTKAQTEENMVDSVRLKEIHACLGAGEFAYYDNNGNPTPYVMHIARNIDFLMKSFGIYYNPDGSIQSVVLNPAPPESDP